MFKSTSKNGMTVSSTQRLTTTQGQPEEPFLLFQCLGLLHGPCVTTSYCFVEMFELEGESPHAAHESLWSNRDGKHIAEEQSANFVQLKRLA